MYLRKVTVRASDGTPREYLRVQESYRQRQPDGTSKHRQRVICSLGRVDLLQPHAARLYELLTSQRPTAAQNPQDGSVQAWDWGALLVLRTLWDELHLDRILRRLGQGPRDPGGRDLAERTFALVANRLLGPSSEHGLAPWLEAAYVCDDRGRRWRPQRRDDAERLASKTPRVAVEFAWLQRWYRTLDRLVGAKQALELALFEQLRTLFEVQVELALYDITSTYFKGHGPPELAKHGYSRDHRPRERQVVLGLVLIDGWPIAVLQRRRHPMVVLSLEPRDQFRLQGEPLLAHDPLRPPCRPQQLRYRARPSVPVELRRHLRLLSFIVIGYEFSDRAVAVAVDSASWTCLKKECGLNRLAAG